MNIENPTEAPSDYEDATKKKLEQEKINARKEVDNEDEARKKWNKVKKEMEEAADVLGYEIEKDIMEPVVALNVFGINTNQSCAGHIDRGMSAPWISIKAPDEPEEQFSGQNESFERVAKKYEMPVEEAKRMFNEDAYWEAIRECEANDETEEYKKWKEEGKKLLCIIKKILNDFYKDRYVSDSFKIKTTTIGGSFRIFNGGDDYRGIGGVKLSEEEKESLSKRLEDYRKEMQDFAAFLKSKFFSEGECYINEKRSKADEKADQEKVKKLQERIKNGH